MRTDQISKRFQQAKHMIATIQKHFKSLKKAKQQMSKATPMILSKEQEVE